MRWIWLLLAAGCDAGSYQIWIEYERDGISVNAWDAADEECGEWYPRDLEGFSSDGDQQRGTCRDVVDGIFVRLPNGRDAQWFTQSGGLYFASFLSLDPGEIAEIEVQGRYGTRLLMAQVPVARPEQRARVLVWPEIAVSWSAEPADLACIHAAVTTHGSWRCGPDTGHATSSAPAYNSYFHILGVVRLWNEVSEPGLEVWQRQELTLEYQGFEREGSD